MAHTNDPVDVFKFIDMRGPDECWPWLGTLGRQINRYTALLPSQWRT